MLGSGGGELGGGNSLAAREFAAPVMEDGSLGCAVCVVLSPYLYCCCSCSLLFAVSVKLPLSQPTSFCLLLSILLYTPAGGGAALWSFCCQPHTNHSIKFGAQAWGRDNGRAEQRVLKLLS